MTQPAADSRSQRKPEPESGDEVWHGADRAVACLAFWFPFQPTIIREHRAPLGLVTPDRLVT